MQAANDLSTMKAVPDLLRAVEKQLDQTVALLADLNAALPRARIEARLSGVVGQSVFKQMVSASASLVDARGHVVNVHNLLDGIARRHAIEYAAGDEQPKPLEPFTTAEIHGIGVAA